MEETNTTIEMPDTKSLSLPERIKGHEEEILSFPENCKAEIVSFIGAIGVGKSILVSEIEKAYGIRTFGADKKKKSVMRIEELSRRAITHGLPINEKTTLQTQAWIFGTTLLEILQCAPHFDILLTDRLEENIVFPENKFGKYLNLDVFEAQAGALEKVYPKKITRFYVPYFLNVNENDANTPLDDGIRSTDSEWKKSIDQRIPPLYARWKIPYYRLPTPKELSGTVLSVVRNPATVYDYWKELVENALFENGTMWIKDGHIWKVKNAVYEDRE